MMLKIALLAGAAAASTQKDASMAALRTAAERELTNNHDSSYKRKSSSESNFMTSFSVHRLLLCSRFSDDESDGTADEAEGEGEIGPACEGCQILKDSIDYIFHHKIIKSNAKFENSNVKSIKVCQRIRVMER